MKLFGKALFEKKQIPTLYDFAQHGILRLDEGYGMNVYAEVTQEVFAVGPGETAPGTKAKKPKKVKETPKPTPKEVFQAETLNTPGFTIKTDKAYLDTEIATLKDKLDLFAKPQKPSRRRRGQLVDSYPMEGAVHYGRQEVESMIERLQNRQKLVTKTLQERVNKYPHTTNDAIRAVLNDNKHLQAITIGRMLPDMPKEAVDAIKDYKTLVQGLCGKDPVFYLIREKQSEKDIQRKRDPILLAQSPFGFFWQILGAWDKEIVLLDEL